ncbi:hypothetical protein ANO14919_023050 [Xylariales sp. No.14919]|nr:hypothetical protein ANO14919_023050 [Xylariales sp. No.14919]
MNNITVPDATSKAAEWVAANLGKTATVCVAVVCILAPMLIASPILRTVGFVPLIRAGSIAARVQARIGNVVARRIFATLQSAATRGYGVARVVGVAVPRSVAFYKHGRKKQGSSEG